MPAQSEASPMRHWWVNQNQVDGFEVPGVLLWFSQPKWCGLAVHGLNCMVARTYIITATPTKGNCFESFPGTTVMPLG